MTTPRTVDPSLRHGDAGESWGNLAAPAGAFTVGETFLFQGEGALRVVQRVLAFPTDRSRRLVYYESTGS